MTTDWGDVGLPSEKASIINAQRQEIYGDPTPNMEMLSDLWGAYLGIGLSAEDVAMMMVLLKIMREKQGGFQADFKDNLDDICGWANVVYKAKEAHNIGFEPTPAGA